MRYASGVLLLAVSLSCASSTTTGGPLPGQGTTPNAPSAINVVGVRVLLMPISDGGNTEDGIAPGSGAAMSADLRDKILQSGMAPLVSEATKLQAAIEQARSLGYDLVMEAAFTDWQDIATEWSGRPDHAGLSAELYDAWTATLLATATDKKKGSALSFVS